MKDRVTGQASTDGASLTGASMLRRSSVTCKLLLSSMICTEWELVKSQLASCAV